MLFQEGIEKKYSAELLQKTIFVPCIIALSLLLHYGRELNANEKNEPIPDTHFVGFNLGIKYPA